MIQQSANEGAGDAASIVIVQNWVEELKQRVPRK